MLYAAFGASCSYAPKAALRGAFAGQSDAVLACPTTKGPLRPEASVVGAERRRIFASAEGARYPVRSVGGAEYADLLKREPLGLDALAGEVFSVLSMQTGFFRSPLTAYIYERGWRQNFEAAGFPGIEREFEEVSEYFAPAADGGVVVDLSCGSGLMSRRLVRSGRYERVLALDYSEQMLRETSSRFAQEAVGKEGLTLVRADAAELPLRTGAVDALHAGAALHCWPRLEESLAEVRRALRPGGGRFFATTFFEGAVPGRRAQQQQPGSGAMRFFAEGELEALLVDAGFPAASLAVRREGRACAVIRAEV